MTKKIFIGIILITILTGTIFFSKFQPENSAKISVAEEFQAEKFQAEEFQKEQSPGKFFKAVTIPPNPSRRPIRMLFFGDLMLGRHVRTLIDKNGADKIFEKIREENAYFDGYYDLVIANLEGPIVSNPIYHESGTTFGFAPDSAKIIQKNNIDLVSLANNHTLDRGQKGLEETKKYLKDAGVEFFGHPIFPETEDIFIKEIRNKKFAFIGLHDATRRLDERRASVLIQQYNKEVDAVIVFIHWGTEYVKNPNQRQQDLAHLFINSGADLVIGHHPHWVQTRENYKGVEIFYSLGNFIFDQYWSDPTQHGLAVEVEYATEFSPQFEEMPFSLYKSIPVWDAPFAK